MSDQTTPGNETPQPAGVTGPTVADVTEAAAATAPEALLVSSNTPPDAKRKHAVFEHAESIGKLAGVVVGGLYVLGVLISNVQLMELGISDFGSLQPRNVLTGLFFVFYVLWFLVLLSPLYLGLAFVVYRFLPEQAATMLKVPSAQRLPWRERVTIILLFLLVVAFLPYITGVGLTVLYPWGSSPRFILDREAMLNPIGNVFVVTEAFARFYDAYINFKTFVAAGYLFTAALLGSFYFVFRRIDEFRELPWRPRIRRFVLVICSAYFAGATAFLLFVYANEIHPNLRYNLGGGQPQAAEITIAGKASDLAGLHGTRLCCEPANAEQTIAIKDVVIWYQSDKFLYLSSFDEIGPAKVFTIDLKLVRNTRFEPKYVQVYSGSSILRTYERTADGIKPIATPAPAAAQPIVWAQLHPDAEGGNGQLIARAVVEDGACPTARFDPPDPSKGSSAPMTERWSRTDGPFPVKVCEIVYAGSVKATIGDTVLKPRPPDPTKIVVIGDTGCRIAKWGMQDCNDPDEWPFAKIAAKAAAHNPELIIHVGDYQYREACLEADAGKCAGLALGDVWPAWRKDFFEPAGKLLAAAPWVMLRGNHEDMARAGAGWLRLFSPFPRTPGAEPLPDDVRPYVLRFGSLTLAILDVANEREPEAKAVRSELYSRWMRRFAPRFLPDPARQNWLFLHKPPWVHLGCKDADCKQTPDPQDTLNSVRDRLRNGPPTTFDLVFGGDTHMFQFFVPQDRKISPQLVAGMSGTLLEAERAYPDAALDKPVKGPLFDVDGTLWMHRGFGYLVLTKQAGAWSAALHDPDGKLVLTCDLAAGALDNAQSDFPCK